VITGYLAWTCRRELSSLPAEKSPKAAAGLLIAGAFPVAMAWMMSRGGVLLAAQDRLFYSIISFVTLVVASGLFFFGRKLIWSVAFPISLLFFLAPLPKAAELGIESFFQQTSAVTAAALFEISGAPMFREGLKLHLPGIVLEVARECSGIRSSLVLFITSLIAGYLFLRNPWKRAFLALLVIPLGIVRNGFRIFTIGTLCIHMGPGMINSWIHRKGGPVFFILSLVPFFGVLLLLLRTERKDEPEAATRHASS
jgi:exosortase C (VPDSG-CTERM-specific)